MTQLRYVAEPSLFFGHNQEAEDPRDGLFLFGPVQEPSSPKHLRVGVIGTPHGIERYTRWVRTISSYVPVDKELVRHSKPFPGFEAAFECVWNADPACSIEVQPEDIDAVLPLADRYRAIYKTVGLFSDAIVAHLREEESRADFWFVVIPDDVHRLGRPKALLSSSERIGTAPAIPVGLGRRFLRDQPLFEELTEAAEVYRYERNFHHQLKSRLLPSRVVVQVVRESTLTPGDFAREGRPFRRLQDPASIA